MMTKCFVYGLAACLAMTAAAAQYDSKTPSGAPVSSREEQRIYGGNEAKAEDFPFIVGLRRGSANATSYCGAALIAPQYVVTAAHCVKDAEMFASMGSRFASGEQEGERIKVAESYVHPKYVAKDHLYDVAILKLERPATVKHVPICLEDLKENSVATVRGWGRTESGKASDLMLEVSVRVISNAECNKQYNNRITDYMVCAGEGNGKDTCQGDSGGPLMYKDKLVAVVSWGGKCGEQAGVYGRLNHVTDFIGQYVPSAVQPGAGPAPTSASPTQAPTQSPSQAPTQAPTQSPSQAPTSSPITNAPSSTPSTSVRPSLSPKSQSPTSAPVPSSTPVVPVPSTTAPTPCPPTPVPSPTTIRDRCRTKMNDQKQHASSTVEFFRCVMRHALQARQVGY